MPESMITSPDEPFPLFASFPVCKMWIVNSYDLFGHWVK